MSSILKNLAIGIILVGVLYLGYLMFFAGSGTDLATGVGASEGQLLASEFLVRLNELQAIDFSLDLFDDPRFRSLVSFGTTPEPVAAGRPNPFSR